MLLGILVGIYFQISSPYLILFFFFFCAVNALMLHFKIVQFSGVYSFKTVDVLFLLLFFIGGIVLVEYHQESNYKSHFSNIISSNAIYSGKVVAPISVKNKSVRCEVKIVNLIDSNLMYSVSGRALVYIEKDKRSLSILQGDNLDFCANWHDIDPPSNPGQFNYKSYLSFHQINRQAYLDSASWKIASRNLKNPFTFSNLMRNYFLALIKKSGVVGDQLAVVSALSIGYKDDISSQLKHAYSSAGAMHVLAVSGLHVGILYSIIHFLISGLLPFKRLLVLRAIVVLCVLWFYAMLTGLSPSVLRATTMLSFVVVGMAMNRKVFVYNNIAASAFFLLFLDPFIIMQVGFQLSYLAVLGILYFQPKLFKLVQFENYFLNKIWAIVSVSLAAQLATFPVGVLYFHQFPVYFIISNLIVIPAAYVLLVSCLLLLVAQFFETLYFFLGKVINITVYVVNLCVTYIDQMPFSLIEKVSISVLETYLIYLVILCFTFAFRYKKLVYIIGAFTFLLIIGLYDCYEDLTIEKKRELVIYNTGNSPAITLFFNRNHFFIADSSFYANQDAMLFSVKHHWYDLDIKETQFFDLSSIKTIGIKNKAIPEIAFNSSNSTGFDFFLRISHQDDTLSNDHDVLLIQGGKKLDYAKMVNYYSLNRWVAYPNLSYSQLNKIKQLAADNKIEFHDINDGAFIVDF
ncbi:MAG: ComEC/Rec2 family competence protein [Parvicellaceae bacterium]